MRDNISTLNAKLHREIIKIALCDDLAEERHRLVSMLQEYCTSRDLCVDYQEFDSGEALLDSFTPDSFSLIFLDIYMKGINGVETAKILRATDPDCVIIFTTTSYEHGADAFDLDAFHYLVKPFNTEKFFSVMNKWYEALCEVRTVTLKCGRTMREIFVRDILFIEVHGRNSTVHTLAGTVESSLSLSHIGGLLPVGEFIKPIRYSIAALRHIVSIGEDFLILSNGEKLPISRRERENIRQQLASYRLRVLRRR